MDSIDGGSMEGIIIQFSKQVVNFLENFFQEYHLSVKQIDPDQARHFVGPDLGPICLQRL